MKLLLALLLLAGMSYGQDKIFMIDALGTFTYYVSATTANKSNINKLLSDYEKSLRQYERQSKAWENNFRHDTLIRLKLIDSLKRSNSELNYNYSEALRKARLYRRQVDSLQKVIGRIKK